MEYSFRKPYLIFVANAKDKQTFGKTASGLVRWKPNLCAGQFRESGDDADLGIQDMSIEKAVQHGVGSLIVGTANIGGKIPETWIATFLKALNYGLDIVSGMHEKLSNIPSLVETARFNECNIYDVRHPDINFPIATGKKRSGKRILTVGTDCAVGKMLTALKLTNALDQAGENVDFRATGQTGIMIKETGIPLDAIPVDFASGAAEYLTPDNTENHWDIIEGQASIYHPSYGGETLALVYGSQPDYMVLCHEATRKNLAGLNWSVPPLDKCIIAYESAARFTNPEAKVIGVSVNTSKLHASERQRYINSLHKKINLPVVDVEIDGVSEILAEVV